MATKDLTPIGYQYLVEHFGLNVVPHHRASYVAPGRHRRQEVGADGRERHVYSKGYAPENTLAGQLEFALKYDGINLEILEAAFQVADAGEIEAYIKDRPTSKYARSLWYLYEWLTGTPLDLPNLKTGNYIDLLNSRDYFTVASPIKSSRHRVNDNLLGGRQFCPIVRKTDTLKAFIGKDLRERARKVLLSYDADALHRASQYLYLKETKSSYEIEREKPDKARANRFVRLLGQAGRLDVITKQTLIEIQNTIVDSRYADTDYRTNQNYVGETLSYTRERIHYVSPKPEDVPSLMDGLLELMKRTAHGEVDPVVQSAAASFGFVFVHPFEDGNGRIHRFLVHQILSREGFTPEGIVFPVSAVMLSDMRAYDACLEQFSTRLVPLLNYDLHDDGTMDVKGDTASHYRYFDATPMAEYLYAAVEKTIQEDLVNELDFVVRYREAKKQMQSIVDMPDRRLDLFANLCLQNHGDLSQSKRKRLFPELADEEVLRLETVIKETLLSQGEPMPDETYSPAP